MSQPLTIRGLAARCAAIGLLAGLAAGCANIRDEPQLTGSIPTDYRDRHPIVLREAPRTLDLFGMAGGSLDQRQEADLVVFVRDYQRSGHGSMVAYVPNKPGAQRQVAAIRSTLGQAGLTGTRLSIVSYTPDDPTLAAPVRLSFSRLQAQVDSRCDEWSEDIAQTKRLASWENRNYPNFGCSYQKNLAMQVAEPLDLVRPRLETGIDSEKRLQGVQRIRSGKDASTIYNSTGPTINQAISNP